MRLYLEQELQPALTDPRLRFQTLVAAHVLGIVERELPQAERLLAEESACLAAILGRPVAGADVPRGQRGIVPSHPGRPLYDEAAAMQALLGAVAAAGGEQVANRQPALSRSAAASTRRALTPSSFALPFR